MKCSSLLNSWLPSSVDQKETLLMMVASLRMVAKGREGDLDPH